MPSSLFQMKRHTRRPPPTCKSSWREGRIQQTAFRPAVLTGWVRWIDLAATPPINHATLIDVYALPGPTFYKGSTKLPDVTFDVELTDEPDPLFYFINLKVTSPTWTDDDSWHNLNKAELFARLTTGIQSHIYTPGADENWAQLST